MFRLFAPQNRVVTLKLIRYTLFMVLFPLSTFYFFQTVVFRNDKSQLAYSGLAAVVAVNVVIYAYVAMAWNENKDELEDGKSGNIKRKKLETSGSTVEVDAVSVKKIS